MNRQVGLSIEPLFRQKTGTEQIPETLFEVKGWATDNVQSCDGYINVVDLARLVAASSSITERARTQLR
jgi:hypothetical protein